MADDPLKLFVARFMEVFPSCWNYPAGSVEQSGPRKDASPRLRCRSKCKEACVYFNALCRGLTVLLRAVSLNGPCAKQPESGPLPFAFDESKRNDVDATIVGLRGYPCAFEAGPTQAGSPARRRPSTIRAVSSGRRKGRTSFSWESRNSGSTSRRSPIASRALSILPASA